MNKNFPFLTLLTWLCSFLCLSLSPPTPALLSLLTLLFCVSEEEEGVVNREEGQAGGQALNLDRKGKERKRAESGNKGLRREEREAGEEGRGGAYMDCSFVYSQLFPPLDNFPSITPKISPSFLGRRKPLKSSSSRFPLQKVDSDPFAY